MFCSIDCYLGPLPDPFVVRVPIDCDIKRRCFCNFLLTPTLPYSTAASNRQFLVGPMPTISFKQILWLVIHGRVQLVWTYNNREEYRIQCIFIFMFYDKNNLRSTPLNPLHNVKKGRTMVRISKSESANNFRYWDQPFHLSDIGLSQKDL